MDVDTRPDDDTRCFTHGAVVPFGIGEPPESRPPAVPDPWEDAIAIIQNDDSPSSLGLSCLNPFGNIHSHQLVRLMLEDNDHFFGYHRYFLIGRSFAPSYQSAICRLLDHSPRILTDAYLAVFELMDYAASGRLNLDKGANCIRDLLLATASILEAQDAAVVLMLGQILLVYNIMVSCPGTRLVTQNTLLAAKDWYPALTRQPELNCITILPVFIDTIQCLVRRELPVVRLSISDEAPADRFLGLCTPLLPLLSSLCEISYAVKSDGSALMTDEAADPYLAIEHQIKAWQPFWMDPSFQRCAPREAAAMVAQARIYRAAVLLVIHRLRYPLGVQDGVGGYYARIITREFHVFHGWDADDASGFGANFPLLVASLETPDLAKGLLKMLRPLRPEPQRCSRIIDFAEFARMQERHGFRGLWFELAHDGLCGTVLP